MPEGALCIELLCWNCMEFIEEWYGQYTYHVSRWGYTLCCIIIDWGWQWCSVVVSALASNQR